MSAYPARDSTPSWMRAPPESLRPITGAPTIIAWSMIYQFKCRSCVWNLTICYVCLLNQIILVRSKNAQQPTSPCRSSERELLINCLQTLWSPENRRVFHSGKQNWDIKILYYCKPDIRKVVSYLAENIHQSAIDPSLSGHYAVSWVLNTGACKRHDPFYKMTAISDWISGLRSVNVPPSGPRVPVPWFRITYMLDRRFKLFFFYLWNCQT